MFGWEELELRTAIKGLLVVTLLLVIFASVSFYLSIRYATPKGILIPSGSDFFVILQYSDFWVKFYRIVPMPPSFDFEVFYRCLDFWVKWNGFVIFRSINATFLSLIVLVFASWTVLPSFGGVYVSFIYQLKRKGGYETLGEANKRLKEIIKKGTKKEKAVIFSSIIVYPAFGICIMIFLFFVLLGSDAATNLFLYNIYGRSLFCIILFLVFSLRLALMRVIR